MVRICTDGCRDSRNGSSMARIPAAACAARAAASASRGGGALVGEEGRDLALEGVGLTGGAPLAGRGQVRQYQADPGLTPV